MALAAAAGGARPAVTTQKRSRGPERRDGAPAAVSSSPGGRRHSEGRDAAASTARAVRGSPKARVRGVGGGSPQFETRAPLPAHSVPASPGNPPSTRGGDPRRRSPGRAPAGTPATPGQSASSPRRFRARHGRPRSRAPEVPPPARLFRALHWSLDLLNHRRRWRLVEPHGASGRPACPPARPPRASGVPTRFISRAQARS